MSPLGMPEPATDWFRFENVAKTQESSSADVYIYGVIGGGFWSDGVSANEFVQELAQLDVEQINLFVNSPGGSVSDGIAMRNALKRHSARVVATVDALAASAASFLLTGADEVVMGQNTELMIHDALRITLGNAEDHRGGANDLDRVSDNIASMYASRAGGDAADWRALMIAETWYTAQEAVDAGLADRVEGVAATDAENAFDLSIFAHAGRSAAPDPMAAAAISRIRDRARADNYSPDVIDSRIRAAMTARRTERPAEPGTTNQEGVDLMADLKNEIRNRLGITAEGDLDDATILAALDEALTENAETTNTTIPAGTTLVEDTVLNELRADAAAGRDARNEQIANRRESKVQNAIEQGKIAPARAEHWRAALNADEDGATETLNSLAAGLVVPTTALGVTGGVEESSDEDRIYDHIFSKEA